MCLVPAHSFPVTAMGKALLRPYGGDTCLCPPPGGQRLCTGEGGPFWLQTACRLLPGAHGCICDTVQKLPEGPSPSKGRPCPLEEPLQGAWWTPEAAPQLSCCPPGLPALCRFGCSGNGKWMEGREDGCFGFLFRDWVKRQRIVTLQGQHKERLHQPRLWVVCVSFL